MTQLLREKAKERGIKGYSVLSKANLELALAGKPIVKELRKNQVCVATQTEFPVCKECALEKLLIEMVKKAKRNVILDGNLEIDADTGEVLRKKVDEKKYNKDGGFY